MRVDKATPPRIAVATADAVTKHRLRDGLAGAVSLNDKIDVLDNWLHSTRLMRANLRMWVTRGNLLAGGIAYAALFSLFAALVVGVTFVMVAFGNYPEFRDRALQQISNTVPGIIDLGDGGLIQPEMLMIDTAWNPATIIGIAILLWSARAMIMALRRSMRAVAGMSALRENPATQFARDLGGLTILGLSVVVTTGLVLATQTFGRALMEWLSIQSDFEAALIRISAVIITFAVDFGLFVYLFRYLAVIRAPKRELLLGAGLGAVGAGVLRVLGTFTVTAPGNPLLASAATIVAILILVNLVARMALLVTAFMVNPPAPVIPQAPEEVHYRSTPNYVTVSVPETLHWDHDPTIGTVIPDPTLHPEYEAPVPPRPKPERKSLWQRFRRRSKEG